jgi:hAT family C-terminal dimerisation region
MKASINPEIRIDPIHVQVNDFFDQRFQANLVLAGQNNRSVPLAAEKIGCTNHQWLENVELIAKHFDVLEWWNGPGKNQFPLIYPVAMCMLSLPDSNGHQERTFSAATWMDGKLNSMQKDITFQMKVLTYKNEGFLERYSGKLGDDTLQDAEKRTKDLLKLHVGSKKEEEIESETEDMMDLYNLTGGEQG